MRWFLFNTPWLLSLLWSFSNEPLQPPPPLPPINPPQSADGSSCRCLQQRGGGGGILHVISLPKWKHKHELTAGTTFPTSVTRHLNACSTLLYHLEVRICVTSAFTRWSTASENLKGSETLRQYEPNLFPQVPPYEMLLKYIFTGNISTFTLR